MINYNTYDLELYNNVLCKIEKELGMPEVTDDEVWELAKEYDSDVVMENLLMGISVQRITEKLEDLYPGLEMERYINAHDSSISINTQTIYTVEDFKEIIEEEKERVKNEQDVSGPGM